MHKHKTSCLKKIDTRTKEKNFAREIKSNLRTCDLSFDLFFKKKISYQTHAGGLKALVFKQKKCYFFRIYCEII